MILIRPDVETTSSCAAPLCVRPPLASINCSDCSVSLVYKRSRRRGPRNFLAKMRRALPKRCRALPGMASGESEVSMPVFFNDFPHHNSRHNSNLINFSLQTLQWYHDKISTSQGGQAMANVTCVHED